jgi:hypothetical protein
MSIVRWKPDTCQCIILRNSETDEYMFEKACPYHSSPAETLAENRSKNTEVMKPIIEEYGTEIVKNPELAQPQDKFVDWMRNEKGKLDYVVVGFTAEEKERIAEIVTKEEIVVKDEGGLVVKEPVVKEIIEDPISEEVIKGA